MNTIYSTYNRCQGDKVDFPNLPHEIILEVFFVLSPQETRILINKLKQILGHLPPTLDTAINNVKLLINFAFQRLYSGKLLVTSESHDKKDTGNADTVLSIGKFESKFIDTKENLVENTHFRKTRPRTLQFRFVRDANDYSRFVDELYLLSRVFEELDTRNEISEYIGIACQLELYLDGYTIAVESPTTILVAVLRTLASFANPNTMLQKTLSCKFKRITLKSTDIGRYYVSQWGQLLGRFSNATYLNLSDNIISLDSSSRNEGELEIKVDLLAKSFVWPSALKELNLDNNLLTYISRNFMKNLPKRTLEKLLICSNKLVSLGQHDLEVFAFKDALPQLSELKLNYNNNLMFINEHMFENIKLTGHFSRLEIKGCNIDEHNLQLLKNAAVREDFDLIL